MKIFYSPSNNGFFHEGVQKVRPLDAFEISEKEYNNIRDGISAGKLVIYSESQTLTLTDAPSKDNTPIQERCWRNTELAMADIELYKVQDTDQNAVGSVSDWRSYRKALRDWPSDLNFPKAEFRPKYPGSKE